MAKGLEKGIVLNDVFYLLFIAWSSLSCFVKETLVCSNVRQFFKAEK